ncbi:Gp19/Gp15/Gp42 family protein [Streptomyces sp. NPDC056485]|uniref:Gp19/Gp15/Gp42 family protein n=1 Tax=Streptomyces sp. NPDC056485 TaxID=3345834 RepID=UPI0036AE2F18
MALATLTEVADRLGRDLTESETRQATALLADATAMITDRFPVQAVTPTAAAAAVCAAMVVRVLRNPDARRTEQLDDYSYTVDNAVSSGQLYVSSTEAELLRPPRTSAFTIVPGAPVPAS